MKNVKTLAAGTAMTLFLAMPALLVGCGGMTIEEVCEDFGAACGQTDADIQQCKDGQKQAEALSNSLGCESEYTDFIDCALANYKTPSSGECNADGLDTSACGTEAEGYFTCVTKACTADPSKCAQPL
ncbi:MAG: hypothetical protein FJ095_18135 [Deltaproteobacteria bacterium]|nr:hypothetical protein [Deltaproteobacteria bacterium]